MRLIKYSGVEMRPKWHFIGQNHQNNSFKRTEIRIIFFIFDAGWLLQTGILVPDHNHIKR